MDSQKLSFTLEWATKNTIRYAEDTIGKPPAIGTLYLQKWLLGVEPPKKLTVTIAEDYAAAEYETSSSVEDKLWDRILQRTDTNSASDDRKTNPSR